MGQKKVVVELKEMGEIVGRVKGLFFLSGILTVLVLGYLALRIFKPDLWGEIGIVSIAFFAFASLILTVAQLKTIKYLRQSSWRKIENLAFLDELTGVYNYRYVEKRLEQELERVRRYSIPLSIIYVDIDHFKKVNDTFGHDAGNRVLKAIGYLFKTLVRENDLVGRVGGDEFVIILPFTPLDEALPVADRIRKKLEEHVFSLPDGEEIKYLRLSMGVVATPNLPPDKDVLIKEADQAMYRAKRKGGNQVSL